MSDPQPFPDQSTTDALSALSALASQASLHPAYEFSPNHEQGGNQNPLLEGHPPPPPPPPASSATHLDHHNEDVEGGWDPAQEQTFADMVAENEAHREQEALEAAARSGNGLHMDAAGHSAELNEGEGSQAHNQLLAGEAVVQAIHAASQAQAAQEAAGNASGGGMENDQMGGGGIGGSDSQSGDKKPKKVRASGTTVINPFAHQWLLENYVPSPQTTIQRTSMYASYVSVCEASEIKPINAATFGKSIRSTFSNVRTRRLGNRGNSRYNYCGLKAITQAELDRLVQFGNVTTENGAICPTKVKRKKPNPNDATDVSMHTHADEYDENDDDGFDEDDEDEEFEDDEDDLLPARPSNGFNNRPRDSSSKRPSGKKPTTVHIVEFELNGQWVPHVSDGHDGYVPSDSKGNPLVPLPHPLGSDVASSSGVPLASAPAPYAAVTEPSTASTSSVGRPKRNRNSLAPDIVASMLDDSDTPSATPKGKKRALSREGDGEWADKGKVGKKPKVGGPSAKSTPKGKGKAVVKTVEPRAVDSVSVDPMVQGFEQLRDVVPALRAVFRTTTPLTQAMDTPDAASGLIDGVVPLTSVKEGKVTILVTAKKYIDHLEKERQKTERARRGLEEFIKKIEGGVEALRGWREYFDRSEKALAEEERAQRAIAAAAAVPPLLPTLPDLREQNAIAGPSSLSGYDPNIDPSLLHPDLQAETSSSHHFSHSSSSYDNLLLHGDNHHFGGQQHYEQGPDPATFDASSYALAALAPALAPALAAAQQQGEDVSESEEVRKLAETRLKNRIKQQQYREKQKSKMLELEEQIRQMNQPSSSSSTSQPSHSLEHQQQQQHEANQLGLQEDPNQALHLHLGQQFKQEAFPAEEQNEQGRLTLQDLLSQQQELQQQLHQGEDQFYDRLDQEFDQLNQD